MSHIVPCGPLTLASVCCRFPEQFDAVGGLWLEAQDGFAAVDAFRKKLPNLFKKVAVKVVVRRYVATPCSTLRIRFDADIPTLGCMMTLRRTKILGRTRDRALTRCLFMAVYFSDGDSTYRLAVLGHVSTRL